MTAVQRQSQLPARPAPILPLALALARLLAAQQFAADQASRKD